MKKWIYMLLAVFFCLVPIHVKAYGIENYYIDATVLKNGDLSVQEYFYLTGSYNGFERIINYQNDDAYDFNPTLSWYGGSKLHNGTGITLEEVRALEQDDSFNFKKIQGEKFHEVDRAEKGDYGVYTIDYTGDGNSYRIYLPNRKKKAFYLKYTLKNMAILHNDVGEIGWNVVGDKLSESVENLRVRVHFPNNQNEFRVWAHGPLHGNVKKVSKDTLEATITGLSSYQAIDVRAVFDKEVISTSPKKSNVIALDKILAYEEDMAAQANYERYNKELQNQRTALEYLTSCEEEPNRYCYNTAKNYVNRVTDSSVFKEYQERLNKLKIIVNQKEEKRALDTLVLAEKYQNYYWYKEAKSNITILENQDLRLLLEQRLHKIETKLTKEEEELDQKYGLVSLFLIAFVLISYLYIYFKYDREYKSEFNQSYLREVPSDFAPTTVSYLFKKKITNDAVSAEILRMIYRKIILYEKNEQSKKEDYVLKINPDFKEPLSLKEERLLKLIFNYQSKITLKEMKKKAKKSASSFATNWDNFKYQATLEAKKENLYEDEKINNASSKTQSNISSMIVILIVLIVPLMPFFGIFGVLAFVSYILYIGYKWFKQTKWNGRLVINILLGIITFVSCCMILMNLATLHFVHHAIKYCLLTIGFTVIGFIYTSKATRRTKEGSLAYAEWKAFKHFLNDFSTMEQKRLPEVSLWEEYLVYALVLGCSKKLARVMKIRLEEMNGSTNLDFNDLYMINYVNHQISRSLTRSVKVAQRVNARNNFSSSGSGSSSGSSSSGSGGGGGFSSGGGSFGGGGGGGRF